MDDGTPVAVRLTVDGEHMAIDFAGTGAAVAGNLNAPRAVVQAAVIYVLRSLVAERIPLNGGCLEPVSIAIPPGSLLDPPRGSAVVGGNVETRSASSTSARRDRPCRGEPGHDEQRRVRRRDVRLLRDDRRRRGRGPGLRRRLRRAHAHDQHAHHRSRDPRGTSPGALVAFRAAARLGGAGRFRGGDGLVRRYRFLAPVTASLLTERRVVAPYGLEGGNPARAVAMRSCAAMAPSRSLRRARS
jgi:5-oxoprolinase (ATP-hydrolysing)